MGSAKWLSDEGKPVAERGEGSIQLLLVTFIPATSGCRHAERAVQFGAAVPRALGPRCESERAPITPCLAGTSRR